MNNFLRRTYFATAFCVQYKAWENPKENATKIITKMAKQTAKQIVTETAKEIVKRTAIDIALEIAKELTRKKTAEEAKKINHEKMKKKKEELALIWEDLQNIVDNETRPDPNFPRNKKFDKLVSIILNEPNFLLNVVHDYENKYGDISEDRGNIEGPLGLFSTDHIEIIRSSLAIVLQSRATPRSELKACDEVIPSDHFVELLSLRVFDRWIQKEEQIAKKEKIENASQKIFDQLKKQVHAGNREFERLMQTVKQPDKEMSPEGSYHIINLDKEYSAGEECIKSAMKFYTLYSSGLYKTELPAFGSQSYKGPTTLWGKVYKYLKDANIFASFSSEEVKQYLYDAEVDSTSSLVDVKQYLEVAEGDAGNLSKEVKQYLEDSKIEVNNSLSEVKKYMNNIDATKITAELKKYLEDAEIHSNNLSAEVDHYQEEAKINSDNSLDKVMKYLHEAKVNATILLAEMMQRLGYVKIEATPDVISGQEKDEPIVCQVKFQERNVLQIGDSVKQHDINISKYLAGVSQDPKESDGQTETKVTKPTGNTPHSARKQTPHSPGRGDH